jgi:hypothetical protein
LAGVLARLVGLPVWRGQLRYPGPDAASGRAQVASSG